MNTNAIALNPRNEFSNPSLTLFAHEHCERQIELLRTMIDQMLPPPFAIAIAYMHESAKHGAEFEPEKDLRQAAFRIMVRATAAQRLQFALHSCYLGMTGSGSYFNTREELIEAAHKHLRYYHRTTPFSHRLKNGQPFDYCFRLIAFKEL